MDLEAQILVAQREEATEHLQQSIRRAQAYKQLLDNPEVEGWFRDSQDSLFNILDAIPLNDTVARDRVVLSIALVRKLKTALHQYVEDGEFAENELKKLLELDKKGLLGGLFGA